jgi:hypothetical protein
MPRPSSNHPRQDSKSEPPPPSLARSAPRLPAALIERMIGSAVAFLPLQITGGRRPGPRWSSLPVSAGGASYSTVIDPGAGGFVVVGESVINGPPGGVGGKCRPGSRRSRPARSLRPDPPAWQASREISETGCQPLLFRAALVRGMIGSAVASGPWGRRLSAGAGQARDIRLGSLDACPEREQIGPRSRHLLLVLMVARLGSPRRFLDLAAGFSRLLRRHRSRRQRPNDGPRGRTAPQRSGSR